jgi:3-hydroxyisobutyrate dehydrogenase-like beta-hydroxyacid dehydrogenase
MFLGMTHGAAVCEAEGVDLELLAGVIPETEFAHHYVRRIAAGTFDETAATLSTWSSAFRCFVRQADEAGINDEMPSLMQDWFRRAMKAGLGEQDVSALIKIFR